jgi:4-aminobutyrate aminotransferase / (S)-3-amino-2-methylpropionate transaminase / 5-aminovalerate transaminase
MELGSLLPRLVAPVPGPRSVAWVEQLSQAECPALTLRRARRQERVGAPEDPIVWARARGANVEDADGNVFVDLSAGFGAASVGHAHPRVTRAITEQSERLLHALGDMQPADVKIALLSRLAQLVPEPARVMLGLSGSDAIEAALKTALLYTGRPGVLAFHGSYHGLSHGPLAACGFDGSFREPFAAQLNPHVVFAPYPHTTDQLPTSLQAVEAAFKANASTKPGAVLVEPILGRGGVVVPPVRFLSDLQALCHQHDALLVVDEIMTGFGRTGRMFGFEHAGVTPDLICVGKGLGGGMPVSACIGRAEVMAAWGESSGAALHTGTFFGHPMSAVAALATLDVLIDERLPERAHMLGQSLCAALEPLLSRPEVKAVRGLGLLVGIELDSPERSLSCMRALLKRGYITVPAGADARVVSLTPPLSISSEQLLGFVTAFTESLR